MKLTAKFFEELTTTELYEILKARAAVFIVDENCAYQDMDDRDRDSLHVFYEEDGKVIAYLRAFPIPKKPNVVQMGRVLTIEHGKGLGGRLLKDGIAQIKEKFAPDAIYIESRCSVTGYYAREGFVICSDEFLEVGIPHVGMELKLHTVP